MDHTKDGLQLISDVIRNSLSIDVSVLMGANLAGEVADEKFCETTIGTVYCLENSLPMFIFMIALFAKHLTGSQSLINQKRLHVCNCFSIFDLKLSRKLVV